MYAEKNARNGFTLIEMLVVLAIMGVIIGMAKPAYDYFQRKANRSATIGTLKNLKITLEEYRETVGEYPQSLNDLIKNPGNVEGWAGPYIPRKDAPKDAWGKPLHYAPTPDQEHDYELYSYGSKKGKGAPKSEWIDAWKVAE